MVAVEVVGLLAAFAVGQFAVDQVVGAVVVIGRAVVGFKALEYVVGKTVARTVFIGDGLPTIFPGIPLSVFWDKNHRKGRLRIDFRRP